MPKKLKINTKKQSKSPVISDNESEFMCGEACIEDISIDDSSSDYGYSVDRLIDHKQENNTMKYYVKWKDIDEMA